MVQFQKADATPRSCASKQLAKLDSGNASIYYDVAKYHADGSVSISSMSSEIDRKIRSICGLDKADTRRIALRKALRQAALKELADKLNAP